MAEPPPKRRKCGNCKAEGHDLRNCPLTCASSARNFAIEGDENENGVGARSPEAPPKPPAPTVESTINWDQVCYVLFDLETTGGSRTDDDIIEIAAMILVPDGIALEDGSFDSLVRPSKDISTFIASLTKITNEMAQSADDFSVVGQQFFEFMNGALQNYSSATSIILVAHNGRAFDLPFLMRLMVSHKLEQLWDDGKYGLTIDTLHICRQIFKNKIKPQVTNMELGTLFQFVTGNEMESSHWALSDVKAMCAVLRNDLFWSIRFRAIQKSIVDGVPSTCQGVFISLPLHDIGFLFLQFLFRF
jgi:DNA polymerase III epsilon subunit-like protein